MQLLNKSIRFRGSVGTARHHPHLIASGIMPVIENPLRHTTAYRLEGTGTGFSTIQCPVHWPVNNSCHRDPVMHEGNIHGKLSVFLYKLPCAVQRINKPEFTPS